MIVVLLAGALAQALDPPWTKAPPLLRNELVPADSLDGQRASASGEVKRRGDEPMVITLTTGGATIKTAAGGEHRDRLLGPYFEHEATPSLLTTGRSG